MSIDEVLAEAREAQERLAESREGARESAIAAIRALERRLVELIGDDRLRGMPNLVPGPEPLPKLFALRVRSPRDKRGEPLVPEKKRVLVLNDEGQLRMAQNASDVPVDFAASDDELLIEDVEAFADTALVALRSHLLGMARTQARYESLDALAKQLRVVLEPGFRPAKTG